MRTNYDLDPLSEVVTPDFFLNNLDPNSTNIPSQMESTMNSIGGSADGTNLEKSLENKFLFLAKNIENDLDRKFNTFISNQLNNNMEPTNSKFVLQKNTQLSLNKQFAVKKEIKKKKIKIKEKEQEKKKEKEKEKEKQEQEHGYKHTKYGHVSYYNDSKDKKRKKKFKLIFKSKKRKTRKKRRRKSSNRTKHHKAKSKEKGNKKNKKEMRATIDKKQLQLKQKPLDQKKIGLGKDLYKLFMGKMWIISGGASLIQLSPYSNKINKKIQSILETTDEEINLISQHLKFLLTNSRRTFTEYILEIFLGFLSLINCREIPATTKKIWRILYEMQNLESSRQSSSEDNTLRTNKDENGYEYNDDYGSDTYNNYGNDVEEGNNNIGFKEKENTEFEKENKKIKEKNKITPNTNGETIKKEKQLNQELETIYEQIFTKELLFYWFEKRFVNGAQILYTKEIKERFYNEHLFHFGKSKFILTCLIITKNLNEIKIVSKNYYQLIDLPFDNNPFNLYSNNRGEKQRIIKDLIVKFGLNSGEYWTLISEDYISKMNFDHNSMFKEFPFYQILNNPQIHRLLENNQINNEQNYIKKRVIANRGVNVFKMSNLDWILKKN